MRVTCFLLALFTSTPAAADSVAVSPARDNTLFSDPAGALSSGAGPHFFAGNNSVSNTRRGVVAFDVAAFVPVGATVDSVTLRLFISSAPTETPQAIALHRLLSDWGEGTSVSSGGAGAASTANDATWIHTFFSTEFWSNAGGDFDATASAQTTVGSDGQHAWSSPAMTADVQHWLDAPEDNFGWLVKGDETTASTVRRFDSRENVTVENRPTLTIHYTTASTPVKVLTWGACKDLYLNTPGRTP